MLFRLVSHPVKEPQNKKKFGNNFCQFILYHYNGIHSFLYQIEKKKKKKKFFALSSKWLKANEYNQKSFYDQNEY